MNTNKLVRIGIALIGGEILFANIVYTALLAWDYPEAPAVLAPVIAPGITAGAVIVTGAWIGKTADRRFVGACAALAGAVFLWTYFVSAMSADSSAVTNMNVYVLLFFSPAGAPLEVALFVIGLKIFARERLAGLCMMVPGAGFLPFLVYVAPLITLGSEAAGTALVPGEILVHGGIVVGAAMLFLGLAMVWHARHTRSDHAPVTAQT